MKSLGTRIALALASLLFALMLVAGLWIENKLTQAIYNEEIDQAKMHAQTLLSSLRVLMLNGKGTLAREWLDSMHGTAGIVDIEVLRRNGEEAFTDLNTVNQVNEYISELRFERESVPSHHAPFPSATAFEQAIRGEVAVDLRFAEELTVLQPIDADPECLACHGYDTSHLRGVLKLSLSRQKAIARIDAMRVNLWGIAVVLGFVIALGIWLALRIGVLGPIERLRDAIARFGAGERNIKLPVHSSDELGHVTSVFNDMQDKLTATETRIRAVTDNVFDAIITADEKGVIESVNPAVERMFGYVRDELLGKNVSLLMPEPYSKEHDRYLRKYLLTGKGRIINNRAEIVGVRKDGEKFPLEISLREMLLGERRYFVAVVRDITENKRQTEALEYQALHDALTELPNRTLLSDRIRQNILLAQRDQQPLALLIMDLDRFKDINDTLGHQYGDRVLQEVAKRMRAVLRESDTIARLGGDEFAVLLPRTSADQAQHIADKILDSIEEPFVLGEQVLHVGVSIGISLFPQHGDDEITLMQRGDVAMYVAKRQHGGFAVYDPSTDQHSLRNLALLGELRGAIDRDQLVLHFQPKVRMRDRKVFGVEALVRWQHPKHGLMYPDEFVPLAEQTGLIGPLSQWVLRNSLILCARMQAENINLDIAVNLSVRNLQDAKFSLKVAELFKDSECTPEHIRLEITETAIMADPVRAFEMLGQLSAMGIKLSIDDFGTGYSSLAHLKQMPVNELKIDKSFVMNMEADENDVVIVRSIIDLAHNIGIHVVAEGVASDSLYDRLLAMGCDEAQGYYICGPLPPDKLIEWLKTSQWNQG